MYVEQTFREVPTRPPNDNKKIHSATQMYYQNNLQYGTEHKTSRLKKHDNLLLNYKKFR